MPEEEIRPEDVEILSEVPTTLYPRPNQPMPVVLVTYAYKGLVPTVVTVPGREPTDAEKFAVIREDIKRRREQASRKLKI
jgi:hypothetical protein